MKLMQHALALPLQGDTSDVDVEDDTHTQNCGRLVM